MGTPPAPALTMNNGNVTGNTASVAGGGIANVSPFGAPLGAVTLHNTRVNDPQRAVPASTFRDPASVAGGGIANVSPFGAPLGAVTLHNTRVNDNNPNNCIPVGSIADCNDSVFVFTANFGLDRARTRPSPRPARGPRR